MLELSLADATSECFPAIAIHKDSLLTANSAKICSSVKSSDGYLYFWSTYVPNKDINATAVLLFSHGNKDEYIFPDLASDEEVDEMLSETFPQ